MATGAHAAAASFAQIGERHVHHVHQLRVLDLAVGRFVDLHQALVASLRADRYDHAAAGLQLLDELECGEALVFSLAWNVVLRPLLGFGRLLPLAVFPARPPRHVCNRTVRGPCSPADRHPLQGDGE